MAGLRVYRRPQGPQVMSFEAASLSSGAPLDADRARQAQRATWVSIAINVVLYLWAVPLTKAQLTDPQAVQRAHVGRS